MRRSSVVVALIGLGLVATGLAFGGTMPGWRLLAPAVLSVVDHSEGRTRCGDWLGQMAAVAEGRAAEYRERCRGDVLASPRSSVILARLAGDRSRSDGVRLVAMRVLVDGRGDTVQEAVDLLDRPGERPAFRRAALRAAVASRGGAAWADLPGRWPHHGLYDTALLEGAAEGLDPAAAAAAMRLIGADLGEAERRAARAAAGLDEAELEAASVGRPPVDWPNAWKEEARGCALPCDALVTRLLEAMGRAARDGPAEAAPALAGDDALLDLLYAEDADHVRAELGALQAWMLGDPARAEVRALDAFASEAADPRPLAERLAEAGDLHAALRHGMGSPGAVAAITDLVGGAAALQAGISPEGIVLAGPTGRRGIGLCGPVLLQDSQAIPPRGGGALALLEAAGAALRRGSPARAALLLAEAETRWPEAPPLPKVRAAVEAAGLALRPPEAPTVLLRPDGRRGWSVGGTLRPGPAPVAAVAPAAEVRAEDPEARSLAAWWAMAYGDAGLARQLLPGPLEGAWEDLRVATLLMLGEPSRPVGPWSTAAAGTQPGEVGCPPAFLPWPASP